MRLPHNPSNSPYLKGRDWCQLYHGVVQTLDYKGVCVIMCAGAHIQLELDMIAKQLLEKIKGR